MDFAVQISLHGKIVDLYAGKKYHEEVFSIVENGADWDTVMNWYGDSSIHFNKKVQSPFP